MATTIPATFRVYRYTEHGDPATVLQLRSDVPQTPLGASQVRVKVLSAATNPVDPFLTAIYAPMLLNAHSSVETPFSFVLTSLGSSSRSAMQWRPSALVRASAS